MTVSPISSNLSDYVVVYKNVIPEEDRLRLLGDATERENIFSPAMIGEGHTVNKDIRDTEDHNITNINSPLYDWDPYLFTMFHKFSEMYTREVYKQFYNIFQCGYQDQGYTILKYNLDQQYTYHPDWACVGDHSKRFMSAVFYLNDDYEGGELEFGFGEKIKPEAGDLIFFPSFPLFMHKSLPIKHGTKYAIVTWFITAE